MYKIIFILFFLPLTIVNAQNNLLAKNYFEQGEYEKALALYTNLYKKNKNFNYFKAIVASHQQLEDYKEAEKLLKERLNIKIIPQLYVELGYNYSLQENDSLATINYNKAILFVKSAICPSVLPVLVSEPPNCLKISFFFSDVKIISINKLLPHF